MSANLQHPERFERLISGADSRIYLRRAGVPGRPATRGAPARPRLTNAIPNSQKVKIFPNCGLATPVNELDARTANVPTVTR